jgi:CRISPR-associated endonuclease/helicase Cas3
VTTIHLTAEAEKIAPENPWNLVYPPLYHQWRTYQALQDHDLVVNAYNTGTGKTIASLLYLFDLAEARKQVLFIAPTNALLHQHAESIQGFVSEHDLDFLVVEINAKKLREIMEDQRPGETLQRLIQNPLTYSEALGRSPQDHQKRPLILVVNPDIFYYALYFRYGLHDQRNIFQRFLTAFDYIVIDEFHYYDSKQLANFLFFFVVSQEFGYFDVGRRICLLSATPNVAVESYLQRIFGSRWALLTPTNEPAESESLSTVPTLTSLRVELVADEIEAWVSQRAGIIGDWLDKGWDGAVISSALWRVNRCFTGLRRQIGEDRLGRITGPEPESQRDRATLVPLILATPTVDIGYNFDKQNKPRQNLDFVICDARYGDEMLQRIGRAGRVLGKTEVDGASQAVVVLREPALQALEKFDGEMFERDEFAALIGDCDELPPKQSLYAYIKSYGITEAFYPIYQMHRMMPEELQHRLDELYARVCGVFAPGHYRSQGGLRGFFSKYWHRQQWLREQKSSMAMNLETAHHVADWIEWRHGDQYKPADLVPHLPSLLEYAEDRDRLRSFVRSQVALMKALFSFRESFEGPVAVVYDRRHLLSSQRVNAYALSHVVSYFQVRWLQDRRTFEQAFGKAPADGALYGVIEGWRDPPLSLQYSFASPWPEDMFDHQVCRQPIALEGLRLTARERGGDTVQLNPEIVHSLEALPIPLMGIHPEDVGVVLGRLRGTSVYARRLSVTFPNGRVNPEYWILLGTQAFHAHAELQGYFLMQDRLNTDAIIL